MQYAEQLQVEKEQEQIKLDGEKQKLKCFGLLLARWHCSKKYKEKKQYDKESGWCSLACHRQYKSSGAKYTLITRSVFCLSINKEISEFVNLAPYSIHQCVWIVQYGYIIASVYPMIEFLQFEASSLQSSSLITTWNCSFLHYYNHKTCQCVPLALTDTNMSMV